MALNPRTSPRLADRDSSRNFSALRAIIPFVRPYRLQVAGAMVALVVASGTVLALGSGLRMLVDQGFADGTLRPMDVDIAQNVLSGAVEASPELANWIADIRAPEVSAAYFNLFINGLARRSA